MDDDFAIRTAAEADAGTVTALLEASYPALLRDHYDAAVLAAALPTMTKANPALLASGRYCLACVTSGQAAGCGGWSHERPGDDATEAGLAHLRHFATHPDWTGRGVGRLIYRRCVADARAVGVTRFECYSSVNAEAFYTALGFRPERRSQIALGDGARIPAIVMRRRL